MLKLSLILMFILSLATLSFAASIIPANAAVPAQLTLDAI
jgi:hypothetical protein